MENNKLVLRKGGSGSPDRPQQSGAAECDLDGDMGRPQSTVGCVAEDRTIRVAVIFGAGGRVFSTGADISVFDRRHADAV
jgi:hypothetical protein